MNRQLLCATLLLLSGSARARAFSDPAAFQKPAQAGGGGGRLFTGSPEDRYSCAVCHEGGAPPRVTVTGLPTRFSPDELYEVTVSWPGAEASHALQLELVDEHGVAPTLQLEPVSVMPAQGRCDGDAEGEPASYRTELDERVVLGVSDCGASRVSFQFRGPAADRLFFALSIVRSDGSGSATGDGVQDVRKVIAREGSEASADGCRLGGTSAFGFSMLWLLVLLAQWKSRPSSSVVSSACTRDSPTKAR